MQRYQKRPVVVEAAQYTGFNAAELAEMGVPIKETEDHARTGNAYIVTLEDGQEGGSQVDHIASPWDWIIKGVDGEFYPCKPTIFDKTYVPAE